MPSQSARLRPSVEKGVQDNLVVFVFGSFSIMNSYFSPMEVIVYQPVVGIVTTGGNSVVWDLFRVYPMPIPYWTNRIS